MLLEKTAIWLNWQVGHWPNPKLRLGLGRELALPLALGIATELGEAEKLLLIIAVTEFVKLGKEVVLGDFDGGLLALGDNKIEDETLGISLVL